jgi:hypothetical protein
MTNSVIDSKAKIVAHFEKFISVNDNLKSQLINRVSLVFFPKGDLIIDASKVSSKSYYILNGLTRTFFIKEGKEINEYFSSENEWANSPRSWRTGKPDIYMFLQLRIQPRFVSMLLTWYFCLRTFRKWKDTEDYQ